MTIEIERYASIILAVISSPPNILIPIGGIICKNLPSIFFLTTKKRAWHFHECMHIIYGLIAEVQYQRKSGKSVFMPKLYQYLLTFWKVQIEPNSS